MVNYEHIPQPTRTSRGRGSRSSSSSSKSSLMSLTCRRCRLARRWRKGWRQRQQQQPQQQQQQGQHGHQMAGASTYYCCQWLPERRDLEKFTSSNVVRSLGIWDCRSERREKGKRNWSQSLDRLKGEVAGEFACKLRIKMHKNVCKLGSLSFLIWFYLCT